MANESPIAKGARITFGYNWWCPLFGFVLGIVSGVILLYSPAISSRASIWYAGTVVVVFTLIPAIFTFRVDLNDDGIFVRHLFSPRRHWIKWYEIENLGVNVLRDFRDVYITMKDGSTFRASIIGTRNGSRLLKLLQSIDIAEMSNRVRHCRKCGYSLKGLETDATTCPECGRKIPPYDRLEPGRE